MVSQRFADKTVLELEASLPEGSAMVGHTVNIPFQIPADTPITFSGNRLKIKYRWKIDLDLAWAFDETFYYDLKIKPAYLGKKNLNDIIPISPVPKQGSFSWKKLLSRPEFWIAFFVLFGLTIASLPILIPVAVAAGGGFFAVRSFLRYQIVQKYSIFIPRRQWIFEESIPIVIRLHHKKNIPINKIHLVLEAEEKFSKGKKLIRNTLFLKEEKIRENTIVTANPTGHTEILHAIRIEAMIPSIPDFIFWSLKVHIDIPGYPDIVWKQDLLVYSFTV